MLDFIIKQHWIGIAIIFFGLLGYIAYIRWRDQHWIDTNFNKKEIKAISFGVIYYGRATEHVKTIRRNGLLLLLKDQLFFRSRNRKIQLKIPHSNIRKVYHDTQHLGEEVHQSLVKIDFVAENKKSDCAAFKVPYPPQWIEMIRNARS